MGKRGARPTDRPPPPPAEEVPAAVREHVRFTFVATMDDVLAKLLLPEGTVELADAPPARTRGAQPPRSRIAEGPPGLESPAE